MSTPEVKCVMDEHGRITYQVTEEGVLLSKWEKEMIVSEFDRLRAENAKLRELLSVMAYCNQFRRDCDGCSMNGAAGIITGRAGCDELLARLRELGIEVE